MPSPFPGMNPWIEREGVWQGFHQRMIVRMGDAIAAQVDPRYFVMIEEHLYVQEEPERPYRSGARADVAITPRMARDGGPSLATLEGPVQVRLPMPELDPHIFLQIRDRESREVTTVIELLSPTNKDRHRDHYYQKREQILTGTAHLVEIDLLRGGDPLPVPDRPECDYSVLVSRAERRPEADFWPIRLRDRLPTIPIPLHAPDLDATVDLQDLLHQIYDAGRYVRYLYDKDPQPPLRAEDQEWARGLVPAKR